MTKAFLNFAMTIFDGAVAVGLVAGGVAGAPWFGMLIAFFAGMHLIMGISYAMGAVE